MLVRGTWLQPGLGSEKGDGVISELLTSLRDTYTETERTRLRIVLGWCLDASRLAEVVVHAAAKKDNPKEWVRSLVSDSPRIIQSLRRDVSLLRSKAVEIGDEDLAAILGRVRGSSLVPWGPDYAREAVREYTYKNYTTVLDPGFVPIWSSAGDKLQIETVGGALSTKHETTLEVDTYARLPVLPISSSADQFEVAVQVQGFASREGRRRWVYMNPEGEFDSQISTEVESVLIEGEGVYTGPLTYPSYVLTSIKSVMARVDCSIEDLGDGQLELRARPLEGAQSYRLVLFGDTPSRRRALELLMGVGANAFAAESVPLSRTELVASIKSGFPGLKVPYEEGPVSVVDGTIVSTVPLTSRVSIEINALSATSPEPSINPTKPYSVAFPEGDPDQGVPFVPNLHVRSSTNYMSQGVLSWAQIADAQAVKDTLSRFSKEGGAPSVIKELRRSDADRAADLLATGRILDFLSMSQDDAFYSDRALRHTVSVTRDQILAGNGSPAVEIESNVRL